MAPLRDREVEPDFESAAELVMTIRLTELDPTGPDRRVIGAKPRDPAADLMFQSGHRLETLKRDDWLQLHGVPSHASMSIYARVAALSGSDSDDGADGGVVKISRRLGTFSRPRGVRRQQRPEADRWWTRIAVSLQTVPSPVMQQGQAITEPLQGS
jgi:hypothetical protein